jgi:hypothetical protein
LLGELGRFPRRFGNWKQNENVLKRNYSNQIDPYVVYPDPRRQRIDIVRDKDDGARKAERSVGIFSDDGEECLPLQKLAGMR